MTERRRQIIDNYIDASGIDMSKEEREEVYQNVISEDGLKLMNALFEVREQQKLRDEQYDVYLKTLTVKVKFPDGVREVPGYYNTSEIWSASSTRRSPFGLTPSPMEGWEFRGIIGGHDYLWVAFQAYRDTNRRLWENEYQTRFPEEDRNRLYPKDEYL